MGKHLAPFFLAAVFIAAPAGPLPAEAIERSGGDTINSTLTNYKIDLSRKSARRGTVTFKINNRRGYHDLCFRGRGIDKCSKRINKGKMTFRINFRKKGGYTAYCSVGNHEKMGMKTKFRIV